MIHTTRCLGIIVIALLAALVSPVLGWEHAAPPAGDECLTNRFGRSWSEAIGNGWLIVGGKYVDAPYIVEQRGYVIYVNGVRVEDGLDVRSVLPMPPPPPISTDPGFPTNLTRDSPLGAVVWPPVFDLKQRYWDHLGLSGDARVKAQIDYLASLPNVAKVEDTFVTRNPAARRRLILYAHDGETMHMNILGGPRPQPASPDDPGLFPFIEQTAGRILDSLRRGETIFANGAFIVLQGNPRERRAFRHGLFHSEQVRIQESGRMTLKKPLRRYNGRYNGCGWRATFEEEIPEQRDDGGSGFGVRDGEKRVMTKANR